MSRARLPHFFLLVLLTSAGCSNPLAPAPTGPTGEAAPKAATVGEPILDFSYRANAVILERQIAQSLTDPWYVRVTVYLPRGSNSPMHLVELDPSPPSADDYTFVSGAFRCVVLRKQVDMLRGSHVDVVDREGRPPEFVVASPNLQGAGAARWLPELQEGPPLE